METGRLGPAKQDPRYRERREDRALSEHLTVAALHSDEQLVSRTDCGRLSLGIPSGSGVLSNIRVGAHPERKDLADPRLGREIDAEERGGRLAGSVRRPAFP
jgi:hypothetical protein